MWCGLLLMISDKVIFVTIRIMSDENSSYNMNQELPEGTPPLAIMIVRITSFFTSIVLGNSEVIIKSIRGGITLFDQTFTVPFSHFVGMIVTMGLADNMFNESRIVRYIKNKITHFLKRRKIIK